MFETIRDIVSATQQTSSKRRSLAFLLRPAPVGKDLTAARKDSPMMRKVMLPKEMQRTQKENPFASMAALVSAEPTPAPNIRAPWVGEAPPTSNLTRPPAKSAAESRVQFPRALEQRSAPLQVAKTHERPAPPPNHNLLFPTQGASPSEHVSVQTATDTSLSEAFESRSDALSQQNNLLRRLTELEEQSAAMVSLLAQRVRVQEERIRQLQTGLRNATIFSY